MAVFVLDTFTASGGAQGNPGDFITAHEGEVGATWTNAFGGDAYFMLSDAGRVRSGPPSGSTAMYTASGTPPSSDYYVEVTLSRLSAATGAIPGVVGRWHDSGDFYALDYNTSTNLVRLERWLDYGASILGTSAYTQAVGDDLVLRLEMTGPSIRGLVNGTAPAALTVTNSDVTAAGPVGLLNLGDTTSSNTTGIHYDNFSAGTFDPLSTNTVFPRWRTVRR